MTIPTTSAAPVNRMPRPRMRRSRSFGRNEMTTAPAVGRYTASVTADFSQPLIRPLLSERREHQGEDRDHGEQDRGVLLHLPGLDALEHGADGAGGLPDLVDGAVDDVAVDDVHAEAGSARKPRCAVHRAVQAVLIRPVDEARDRVLDRPDDPLE